MATLTYLASAALMGVFLLAIVVAIGRARDWRQYAPARAGGGGVASDVSRVARNPATWTVLFVLAIGLVGAGVVLMFTAEAPAGAAAIAAALIGLVAGVGFLFFLFYGSYQWARSHGISRSMAVMTAAWVIGFVVLTAISARVVGLI